MMGELVGIGGREHLSLPRRHGPVGDGRVKGGWQSILRVHETAYRAYGLSETLIGVSFGPEKRHERRAKTLTRRSVIFLSQDQQSLCRNCYTRCGARDSIRQHQSRLAGVSEVDQLSEILLHEGEQNERTTRH